MPTAMETVRCQEYRQTTSTMAGEGGGCITQHSDFPTVCLDVNVLRMAHNTYRQDYAYDADRVHTQTQVNLYIDPH